jgi:hypothetical protein
MFFPQCENPSFIPVSNKRQNYISVKISCPWLLTCRKVLFICTVFKNALSVPEYIASKDMTIMNMELEGTWMESLIVDRTATLPVSSEENRQ